MATMITETNVKMVYISKAVHEECIRRAQVLIVTEETWHLIGPEPYRAHGDRMFAKAPKVTCPIINLSAVDEGNDEKVAEIIKACTAPTAGVINMEGLIAGLSALGGKVTPPPTPPQMKKTFGEGRKKQKKESSHA